MITEYKFFNKKEPKIGDYVILEGYDLYGTIIDSGRNRYEKKT